MTRERPSPATLEDDEGTRYRRPSKPVVVRRPQSWRRMAMITLRVALALVALAVLGGTSYAAYHFALEGEVFRLASLDAVTVEAAEHVLPEAVREQFAADVGTSLFLVPMRERRAGIEEIAWVESAHLQRVFPNGLHVYLRERTPVAFLRAGNSLSLIDAHGMLLPIPEKAAYSFPVLSGVTEGISQEERRERIALYLEFISELKAEPVDYTPQVSELDLADPDNLRAAVTDSNGSVWLELGRGNYREKFETYLEHRSLWRESGEQVRSVDLRYRGQIVLNPASPQGAEKP